ncbi:MAG TPA: DUF6603 domain-containing protein [Steroidobacteraceae bacterium]
MTATISMNALQSLIANALQNGTFSLSAAQLGSPSVTALFTTVLTSPTLTLSDATADTNVAQPVVSGTLAATPQANWPFLADAQVTATFSLDADSVPQVHITLLCVNPPATAPLGAPLGWETSMLGSFAWSGARIDFDSSSPVLLPDTFPAAYGFAANTPALTAALTTGMQYNTTVSYTGQSEALIWLIGTKPVPLSGPISWYGTIPGMDLASAALTTVSVEPFTLSLALHAIAAFIEVPASRTRSQSVLGVPGVALTGTIERPTSSSSVSLPFAIVAVQDPRYQITVIADGAGTPAFSLEDLAALLGVPSLSSIQPDSSLFPLLQELTLSNLMLAINPSGPTLLFAAATVSFTPAGGAWTPFGSGLFAFDGLAVTFTVIGPLSSPLITAGFVATVTLAGGTLQGQVILPSLDFSCKLVKGTTIDLTDLVKEITGGAFGSTVTLLCTELHVLGSVPDSTYRLRATIADPATGGWSLPLLPVNLGLTSIGFDITYVTSGAGLASGQVVAQFLIGGDVPVQISATLPTATTPWSFAGATQGVQDIALNDLLDDLLNFIGLQLPSVTPAVTVTGVEASITGTSPVTFGFSCDATIEIAGASVAIDVEVGQTVDAVDPTQADTVFSGYVYVGQATFEVDFSSAASGDTLQFTWLDTTTPLTFQQVAQFFGWSMPDLPESLDLSLTEASFFYDFSNGSVAASAACAHGDIAFVSFIGGAGSSSPGSPFYVFALTFDPDFSLSQLPVVGADIPASRNVALDQLQLVLANMPLAAADLAQLDSLLQTVQVTAPIAPAIGAGVTLAAAITIDGAQTPLILPLTGDSGTGSPDSATTTVYEGQATWFPLSVTLGPVGLQRIGVQYVDSVLSFLLDGTLSLSTFNFSLQGLGLGTPLTKLAPVFTLDGLEVDLQSGPLQIGGGLLSLQGTLPPNVTYEFIGNLTVAFSPYQIAAAGSYASVGGHPSFFAFAQVSGDFGGPPAFFVTGFMGGFGYNSALTLPTVDQIAQFPFVAGIGDPSIFGANPKPTDVLTTLETGDNGAAWVTPTVGTDWVALGITFRSFELVLGSALVVAEFGTTFEIALLGLASMTVPQGITTSPYAFVSLELEAVFAPEAGTFAIAGTLTPNSFVLTPACRLTGGFAFSYWFGASSHAGDLVVTLGGYHPAFAPPAWYPKVAAVGFIWLVDSNTTIRGSAYFALTPSAIMAGGNLDLTYADGSLNAWFTAWANVLATWKPFSFNVQIGLSIGASYTLNLRLTRLTVKVELGATLLLQGPPTGGTVHIDWYIISFTIAFGASTAAPPPPPLAWPDFITLLPASPLTVSVSGGLTSVARDGTWNVRSATFAFTTGSAIPASAIQLNLTTATTQATVVATCDEINIAPMNLTNVTSTHIVTLTAADGTSVDLTKWSAPVTQTANLPGALWGTPLYGVPPPAAATLVPGLQTGVQLAPPAPSLESSPGPVALDALTDTLANGVLPLIATAIDPIPAAIVSSTVIAAVQSTYASGNLVNLAAIQHTMLATLSAYGAEPPSSALLVQLAAQADSLFEQLPLQAA